MKKILITGSNGLLGQKLVKLITTLNEYQLIATAKGENRIEKTKGFIYEDMDITHAEAVNHVFEKYKPEYLIHCAAMTNVDSCETDKELCWDLNVNAVQYLADACKKYGTHCIHVSTDFIFNGENGPYAETDTPDPISYYGLSKLKAEEILINSDLKWAIARTVLVYGITEKMSRTNIILWVKSSIEKEQTIQVVNDQWRTPTLAEDLAMGCYLMVKNNAKGIYNISGKDLLNPYQMAIMTADFFGLDKKFIVETDGSKFKQTAKRPPKTGFNIEKAIKDLNYQPHSFLEGIEIVAKQAQEES